MTAAKAITTAWPLDWRPIETAPRDGTPILAYSAKAITEGKLSRTGGMDITWWRTEKDKRGYVGWGEFNDQFWPPTHWAPLPAPPTNS